MTLASTVYLPVDHGPVHRPRHWRALDSLYGAGSSPASSPGSSRARLRGGGVRSTGARPLDEEVRALRALLCRTPEPFEGRSTRTKSIDAGASSWLGAPSHLVADGLPIGSPGPSDDSSSSDPDLQESPPLALEGQALVLAPRGGATRASRALRTNAPSPRRPRAPRRSARAGPREPSLDDRERPLLRAELDGGAPSRRRGARRGERCDRLHPTPRTSSTCGIATARSALSARLTTCPRPRFG